MNFCTFCSLVNCLSGRCLCAEHTFYTGVCMLVLNHFCKVAVPLLVLASSLIDASALDNLVSTGRQHEDPQALHGSFHPHSTSLCLNRLTRVPDSPERRVINRDFTEKNLVLAMICSMICRFPCCTSSQAPMPHMQIN